MDARAPRAHALQTREATTMRSPRATTRVASAFRNQRKAHQHRRPSTVKKKKKKKKQLIWPVGSRTNQRQAQCWASLVAQMLKTLPAVQETPVQSLDQEGPLEKEMATHSVFLPGAFHGQRSLACCNPWGCKESDMTEQLTHRSSETQLRALLLSRMDRRKFSL